MIIFIPFMPGRIILSCREFRSVILVHKIINSAASTVFHVTHRYRYMRLSRIQLLTTTALFGCCLWKYEIPSLWLTNCLHFCKCIISRAIGHNDYKRLISEHIIEIIDSNKLKTLFHSDDHVWFLLTYGSSTWRFNPCSSMWLFLFKTVEIPGHIVALRELNCKALSISNILSPNLWDR